MKYSTYVHDHYRLLVNLNNVNKLSNVFKHMVEIYHTTFAICVCNQHLSNSVVLMQVSRPSLNVFVFIKFLQNFNATTKSIVVNKYLLHEPNYWVCYINNKIYTFIINNNNTFLDLFGTWELRKLFCLNICIVYCFNEITLLHLC